MHASSCDDASSCAAYTWHTTTQTLAPSAYLRGEALRAGSTTRCEVMQAAGSRNRSSRDTVTFAAVTPCCCQQAIPFHLPILIPVKREGGFIQGGGRVQGRVDRRSASARPPPPLCAIRNHSQIRTVGQEEEVRYRKLAGGVSFRYILPQRTTTHHSSLRPVLTSAVDL